MVAWVVIGARYYDLLGPLLQQLHWLPIRFQSLFKVLVLTLKPSWPGPRAPKSSPSSMDFSPSSQVCRRGASMSATIVPSERSKPWGQNIYWFPNYAIPFQGNWQILPPIWLFDESSKLNCFVRHLITESVFALFTSLNPYLFLIGFIEFSHSWILLCSETESSLPPCNNF